MNKSLSTAKLISDIRLFESDVPNIDGNPVPSYIGKIYRYDFTDCLDVICRLLFLLRHRGFCFDGFDHLYLNFTPLIPHGEVRDVNRYNIREFSWYQFADIGCDPEIFNSLSLEEKSSFIIKSAKEASLMKASPEMRILFSDTFDEVTSKGERLLIPYKQKEDQSYCVEIFTRINNDLDFIPLIRVSDKDGNLKCERELRKYGRDEFISQIGTVTIGKSSVRIAPRKNSYTDFYDLTSVKLEW